MGVRIIHSTDEAVMYCSTTDWAFGPVFVDSLTHAADERVESFLRFLAPKDPREYDDPELESKYTEWRMQEETQWGEGK